jgi:acetylornithine deacetylase
MKSAKREILEYLEGNRNEIIDFLCEFISKRSVNPGTPGKGEELEAQNWIKKQFEEFGFDKVDYWCEDEEKKRPNVVGVIKGKGKGRSLKLQGHCDVVPVPERELAQWTSDPWKGTVRDGKVYGRGASDTKGGNTAMFWAAKALIDCGTELAGDLYAESVVGEESQEGETIGAASTVKRGYNASFAIVSEPTNCELHIESPGVFFFELLILGKSTHTGARNQVIFPQRYGIAAGSSIGVDAISKMKMFLDLFERLELQWNQRWRSPVLGGGGCPLPIDKQGVGLFTINPSFIEGGTYLGSVPGYCKLTGCVWYPSWVDLDDVILELRERVSALAQTDDWLRENPPQLRAPVLQSWHPTKISMDHEGVKTLAASFEEVTEKKAIHSGFRAVCDATFLNENGVPAMTFGPGDLGTGVHGPNEYVPIAEVVECAKVYAITALNWCDQGE